MRWTVEVFLAITRPPTVQRMSRVIVIADSALEAEWIATAMAIGIHKAEMPVGSRIIDWEE